MQFKWGYNIDGPNAGSTQRNERSEELPPFSESTFLELLVKFIVADDQVCLIRLVSSSLYNVSHLFSLFALSNALNFDVYFWSSVRRSLTLTYLTAIKCARLLLANGASLSKN